MHSGWGIVVSVDERAQVVDRRRIVVAHNNGPRGNQPYHRAEQLGLPKAEKYLADYIAATDSLARQEIGTVVSDLKARGYRVTRASILLASGRTLPPLPKILAAHPLIHTAEGELFRNTARRACESLGIPVMGLRQRDLEDTAKKTLGTSSAEIITEIARAGKSLGPPWTADHKAAALGAYMALDQNSVR